MTPSSLASWTRAASWCARARRAAGGWYRRCPEWPLPTAWPRRSNFRCRTDDRMASMPQILLGTFLEVPGPAAAMCFAGTALLLIAAWATKNEIAEARGLDKIVALSRLCFAIPLAVFGALHLSSAEFVTPLVPSYMPWRLFWTYFVGCALLAASLSIATKLQVRWSGLLFGIMMFAFV